jgi:TPR repeat protein
MRNKLLAFCLCVFTAPAWANPCADLANQTRLLNPTEGKDWACIKYQAGQGNASSAYYVGMVYLAGQSPEGQNTVEGLKWLEKAAHQNNATAQKTLSELYSDGRRGAPRNPRRAYLWYYLARQHAEYQNQQWLPGIEKKFTKAQREEIENEAKSLLAQ